MNHFGTLKESKFVKLVFENALASMDEDPGALAPLDATIDEYQFYRQGVGFHLAHTLTWLDQLSFAVELLTNFDCSKMMSASRADHLIYNVENYLVRVNAAYGRALQLVNSVFHLCVHEEHVTHSVIVANTKVQHRPTVVKKMKALRKLLNAYSQERHTIVHRHSLLDEKMRRIELFDQDAIIDAMSAEKKARLKVFRTNYLREFVVSKKQEFGCFNSRLALAVQDLFDALVVEYAFQQAQFKARGF